MTFDLREYQVRAIEGVREELRAGKKRVMLYSPTGSGKTQIAISIIKAAEEKGKRVLFVANRIQLVEQSSKRLWRSGVKHGIVQGSNSNGSWNRVLVCSIQTLASRGTPEDVDLIIVDEAHAVAGSEAYRKLMTEAQVPVIGLSATPFSRGLGKYYDELKGNLFETIVAAATIRELIDLGFLVDIDVYAPEEPNLDGVKITAGDYNEKQLGERVNTKALVGGIVEHWRKLAGGKPTVCFATNIAHSQAIAAEFNKEGIKAEHIDCFTEEADRRQILKRVEDGQTTVVCNVSVLAEGWDCPAVEVGIIARPTKSLVRWIQMAGRILRPADGKTRALLLDHSGSCRRLGFPTDDLPLELNDGRPKETSDAEAREKEEALPKPCPQCHYMKPPKMYKCPSCGHEPIRAHGVSHVEGSLVKLERKPKATMLDKQQFYSELLTIVRERGYNPHWADHKYRAKFGVWPRGLQDIPAPTSDATRDFAMSRPREKAVA